MDVQETKNWKGASLGEIYASKGPWNYACCAMFPSKYHTILFELPVTLQETPKPHHKSQTFHWDEDYVKMPYASKNVFPVKNENGEVCLKYRWNLIEEALLQPISNSRELEEAINTYNHKLPKFLALHYFFEQVLEENEAEHFFSSVLPGIISLALRLPEVVPGSIPLLKKGSCKSISLSQLQIACLLCNAFLCTFPWRKEMATYPGINFVRLFAAHLRPDRKNAVSEKLKCLCHYFTKILANEPKGVVTFERKFIPKAHMPRWDRLDNNLGSTKLHVTCSGTIEDDGLGMLQVDFANKYVGGGVLGFGCVQEEIRYVICPELIIGRLFVEQLGANEALLAMGIERYSNYSGYGYTFRWTGPHSDQTPRDKYGRRRTTVAAIDATHFLHSEDQFSSSFVLRELNKAFVGFHSRGVDELPAVATGNWGCGAFRGDAHLKSLIQLMACSAANRDMVYFTFGDASLRDQLHDIYQFLANNKVTVVQMWRLLCKFNAAKLKPECLYRFIEQAYCEGKNQLSIKQFFSCFKNDDFEGDEGKEAPSTSMSVEEQQQSEVESPDSDRYESSPDFIESSQDENSRKKPKMVVARDTHTDIVNLINSMDGKVGIGEETAADDDVRAFSILDSFNNESSHTSENRVERADKSHKDSMTSSLKSNKGKITDYFSKIAK